MKRTPNQEILHNDIRRYKNNKFASSMALLAIVFNCLYFCLLYSFRDKFFGTWRLGVSVILTLVVLLVSFLSSEGIKNYNKKFAIPLLILAAVQIIRIFGLPLEALKFDITSAANWSESTPYAGVLEMRYFGIDLSSAASYTIMVIWLAASAACLITSAVVGYINSVKLETFNKKIESGEVVIENTLAEMDKEDNAAQAKTEAVVATEEVQ